MFVKAALLLSACAVAVDCFVTYGTSEDRGLKSSSKEMIRSSWSDNQSWDDQNWRNQRNSGGMMWKLNSYDNSANQENRHVLDSASDSHENPENSSENFGIQKVQKIYHNTNPEEAGNGREVSNQGNPERSLKMQFSSSGENAVYNRINKGV